MPGFDPHATRSALVSWPYNIEFDPDIMPGFDPDATGVALPSSPARMVFDPHVARATWTWGISSPMLRVLVYIPYNTPPVELLIHGFRERRRSEQ